MHRCHVNGTPGHCREGTWTVEGFGCPTFEAWLEEHATDKDPPEPPECPDLAACKSRWVHVA